MFECVDSAISRSEFRHIGTMSGFIQAILMMTEKT